jgi:hypothetical protein
MVWMESFADAMDFHKNDILYERIEKLEKEVSSLKVAEVKKG